MYLKSLKTTQFKNISDTRLEFEPGLNLLLGPNGVGKTNILDAIYTLAFTKSLFQNSDTNCIKFGESFYRLDAIFANSDTDYRIECIVQRDFKKIFKVDGVSYEKLWSHIGTVPLVIIIPDDIEIINGGSELRRKFLDGAISQLDNSYLKILLDYNYVLKQRNALLKSEQMRKDISLLVEPYDKKILELGYQLYNARKKFVDAIRPYFEEVYQQISCSKEVPELAYKSDLDTADFEQKFKLVFERDCILQRTTKGVHTDDLELILNNTSIKKYGSQGQLKTYIFSLKLAFFKYLSATKGVKPILLLDDIFDKLDDTRIMQLLSLVSSEDFEQTIITDARPERSKFFLSHKQIPYKAHDLSVK
jgi:DNA replication and repair protein RecF